VPAEQSCLQDIEKNSRRFIGGLRSELVSEQSPAFGVDAERFCAITRCGVRPHEHLTRHFVERFCRHDLRRVVDAELEFLALRAYVRQQAPSPDNVSPIPLQRCRNGCTYDRSHKGGCMKKVIQCPCGSVIEGVDDDDVVKKAQEHAKAVHGMELSREQALSMARPV
jgi:hypothetical protein